MKHIFFLLCAFLIFSSCKDSIIEVDLSTPTTPTTPDAQYSAMVMDIHVEINNYRDSKSLPPLELNEIIYEESKSHTDYMISKGAISHDNFSERANRLLKSPGGTSVAENVAYGYNTAKAVVNGWINSPGHRKNIEGNFNITGISAIQDKNGRYYFTQIFLQKLP